MAEEQDILDQEETTTEDGKPKPKPKFNPKKSFTPVVEDNKPAFNPKKPFEKKNLGENGSTIPTITLDKSDVEAPSISKPATVNRIKIAPYKFDQPFAGTEITLSDGTPLNVPTKGAFESPDYVNNLQQRINTNTTTPFDIADISKGTGKSPEVINAYVKGGKKIGFAVENLSNEKKTNDELVNTINQFNADYGGGQFGKQYNPQDILSSPEKTAQFLHEYELATLEKNKGVVMQKFNEKKAEAEKLGYYDTDIPALQDIALGETKEEVDALKEKFNVHKNLLDNHIVNEIIKNPALSKDQQIVQIAALTNPRGFKQSVKASVPIPSSPTTPLGGISALGNIYDEIVGVKDKDDLLNTVKGEAELRYNDATEKMATNKISQGIIAGDDNMVQQGKAELDGVDQDAIYKYPTLVKQEIARRVSEEFARETGQTEGAETRNITGKIFGGDINSYQRIMKDMGYLDNPKTKDIAESMLDNPRYYFTDASYLGNVIPSFVQPFKELGLTIGDISTFRNERDLLSDKMKSELFPAELGNLKTSAKTVRTILNTTANLAGMTAIAAGTEGLGTEIGVSTKAAKSLGAYTSFGLPSYDGALKDSYNFLDNDAARTLYASITAVTNAEGGRLLDLGKIVRIPGVSENYAKMAKGLTEKTLTEKGLKELLGETENKYVDFAVRYGKNVTKGAATMAYFNISNNIEKLAFGDPNTKSEDLLPQAGHAFIDGVLGMSIMGAFGAAAEMRNEKNTSYKGFIYNMALNHDATADVFKDGLNRGTYTEAEYNQKMQILNTAKAAKGALDLGQQDRNTLLNENQKSVYVANKTAEAVLRNMAEGNVSEAKKDQYAEQADRLRQQNLDVMEGLQFSPTLEPLYDLFDAEKQYNKALEEVNNGSENYDNVEAAKNNYDALVNKYFNAREAKKEVVQPEEKTFTDFDKTLFHEGKLTPLGEEIKDRISKGEDITVLTSRENTPENISFIAKTLGIPESKIKAGLDAEGKAAELTSYNGKKVFYDDNPDNVLAAQKTDARVVDTGITSDEQRVPNLFKELQDNGNVNEYLNPEKIPESIEEIQSQALTAPSSLKGRIGEKLTLELIARNSVEDINKSIEDWQKKVSGEDVSAAETKDADKHIRLLEKGLETKSKTHEKIQDAVSTTTSTDVTFENAKEGDVIIHNGETVTVVGKTKSRGGNDVIEVKQEKKKTDKEIEEDVWEEIAKRHREDYPKGMTLEEAKNNHAGEFSVLTGEYKQIRDNSKPQVYTIDKTQWDNEVSKPETKATPTDVVEPIRQLGTGANVYFETKKYRVNDTNGDKVLLNVGDANGEVPLANIEFDNVNEAVYVAKKLEENAPNGLTADFHNIDKIVDNFKKEYKEGQNLDISEKNNNLQNNGKEKTIPEGQNQGTGNSTPTFSQKSAKEKPLNLSDKVKQIEDITDPYDRVMKHFAEDGKIHTSAIEKVFGGKDSRIRIKSSTENEKRSRIGLVGKDAPTIDQLAHQLWESDTTGKHDTQDYKDAIERVITEHNSKGSMQKDLIERYDYDAAYEKYLNQAHGQEAMDIVNKMSDDEINHILQLESEKASEEEISNYIESLSENQKVNEEAPITVQDIHKSAEERGIDINTDEFKTKSKELTGSEHLDDMTPEQLQKVNDFIGSETKKETVTKEGEKPPPPKEPIKPKEEGGGKDRLNDKGILNHLERAENVPEAAKTGFKERGLKYNTSSQKEAETVAKSIIDQYGIEDAVLLAEAQKFDGDVNSLIYAESLNRLAKSEAEAKTPEEKIEFAKKFAEVGIKYDEAGRKGGRFNSAVSYFYKKSPLGVQLIENAKRKEDFDKWAKPKEQSWKEVFTEMMKEPEFENLFKEQVQEGMKKERADFRAEKKEKVHKAIDDTIDKWIKKLTPESTKGSQTKGGSAEDVLKSVGAVMKKAYDAGESVSEVIKKAIETISEKLGITDWDKEGFKKDWETKLGKDGGYKESDTRHQTRIDYLNKELLRVRERRSKEQKEKKESTREIPEDEKSLIEQIEKEQSVWDAEKDKAREFANDYQKLETERNRQLKRVTELNEKIDTLRKGQLPETKSFEPKKDTPEIEGLKAEKDALERSVRDSIAHEKKMKGLEAELQRLKDRKDKEPKPDSKRVILEDERLIRDEIEAERKAWAIEDNIQKLQDELERVRNRQQKVTEPIEKRDLTDTEKDLVEQIKAEKELWKQEVEPERKVREALKAAQKSLEEYQRRIDEQDISKKESDTIETPQLKELRDKRDAKRKEYEEMKKQMLKPEKDAEILRKRMEKFINRLKGLTDRQKEQLIQKTFNKIVEEGGLDYPELKKMIAEVTGRGEMTDAEAAKLRELVKETNAVDEAGERARTERTPEARQAFREAEVKAGKASKELNTLLYNRPNITKRLTSLMQLNTLGIPALVNNPIYNIINQLGVRTPVGLVKTGIDAAIYGVAKAFGKEVLPETNILSRQVQREFFRKLGLGTRESVGQFLTGLNRMDYINKEVQQGQQIRPATSARDLWAYAKGEKNLTKKQVIDKIIQASPPGITAEIIARTLNLGDKPQRFAAEGAQAAAFAKSLGLKDIDYDLFIDFPREEAYRVYKSKGYSDTEAAKKADYIKDTIVKEGERSTFQQDNMLNDVLGKVFGGKDSGVGGLAKATIISPYIKIPTNAYWSYYNIVNPEVAMLQSMIYAGKAWAKDKGHKLSFDKPNSTAAKDLNEAKYWFAHAAVGVATRAVIVSLVNQGIFTPANTGDDTKKEREGEQFYENQGTLNVSKLAALMKGEDPSKVKNGLVVNNRWFGQWGTVGNTIARKNEEMTPEQKTNQSEFWDAAIGGMELYALQDFEQGVFGNTSTLLSAVNQGIKTGDVGYGLQSWGINTVNMFTNIVHPAASAQIEKAALPYYTKQKADSFGEEIKNAMLTRSAVLRTLTGQYPPSKIGIWGDRADKKDNVPMRLFGISHNNSDNFAQPIYEDYKKTGNTKFFPPAVMPVIVENGERIKLPAADAVKFEQLVGSQRKALVAPYVNNMAKFQGSDKTYSQLSEEEKLDKLDILYDEGYKNGKYLFLQQNPQYKVPEKTNKEVIEDKGESKANEVFRKALKAKSPIKK